MMDLLLIKKKNAVSSDVDSPLTKKKEIIGVSSDVLEKKNRIGGEWKKGKSDNLCQNILRTV